jgi:hypothetical protein
MMMPAKNKTDHFAPEYFFSVNAVSLIALHFLRLRRLPPAAQADG